MTDTKLYDILRVPPTASDADIKKSYRKLAKEFHPDKNPATGDLFKEITNAYEILSDPKKRKIYDRHGIEALQNGDAGPPTDVLSHLFGGIFGGGRRGPRKADDTVHPLKVTLEDLYSGRTSKLQLKRCVTCNICQGKGSASGMTRPCRKCEGRGYNTMYSRVGPRMVEEVRIKCKDCDNGQVIPDKEKCTKCTGEKVVYEAKILEVYVEKGMRHGEKIVFKGEGDQANVDEPGDVVIILEEQPHPRFKRQGCDLLTKVEIGLTEALCGFSFPIKHLDGRDLVVKCPPGKVISPDAVMGLKEEGMPMLRNPTEFGNLYIKFTVVFPPNHFADENKLKIMESLLPPRPEQQEKGEEAEEVDLHEYVETMNDPHSASEAYEEDDEGPHIHMEGGAPPCAPQ